MQLFQVLKTKKYLNRPCFCFVPPIILCLLLEQRIFKDIPEEERLLKFECKAEGEYLPYLERTSSRLIRPHVSHLKLVL